MAWNCHVCGQCIKCKSTLMIHMEKHTEANKEKSVHKCEICGKTYSTKSAWKAHAARMHSAKNCEKCPCPTCGKVLKNQRSLASHIVSQHKEKRYKCDFCDREFVQRYQLATHVLTHTKKTLFKCCDCGISFEKADHLRKHLTVHDNPRKPWICELCGRCLITRYSMRRHLITYHNLEHYVKLSGIPKNWQEFGIEDTVKLTASSSG